MASWVVHLRIADKLLDQISDLLPVEFVFGNIAPDSGIPNEDWSAFTPSGDVSHFKTTDADGLKDIHINEYVERYYSVALRMKYNGKQKSFYLGYLTHLLTDMLWVNCIVRPSVDKFRSLYDQDRSACIWTMKKDWYDLDFVYIEKNPDFRAYSIYQNAVEFRNEYMDFFSTDAFESRREYILGFYSGKKENLEREYVYLKEEEMDRFVDEGAVKIARILIEEYL